MDLILAIDFGTTSIKILFFDQNSSELGCFSKRTDAYNSYCRSCADNLSFNDKDFKGQSINPCSLNIHDEQNCVFIFNALRECLLEAPLDLRLRVTKIAVCGQMHGVVLWKQNNLIYNFENSEQIDSEVFSPLFTWQDKRCSDEFIDSIPKPNSHLRLASGFGCVTIAYLQAYAGEWLKDYKYGASIMDLFIFLMCDIDKPITSPQVAASWGYFDTITSTWNLDTLDGINFPVGLLPEVRVEGSVAGNCRKFLGVGDEKVVEVFVSLGDMQCSVLANLIHSNTAVLNIGTSSQLSTLTPTSFQPSYHLAEDESNGQNPHIQYFPFFKNRYLRVAASLNGGNTLESFVKYIEQVISDISINEIWSWLTKIDQPINEKDCQELSIEPYSVNQLVEACYENNNILLHLIKISTSPLIERNLIDKREILITKSDCFLQGDRVNSKAALKVQIKNCFNTLCQRVINNLVGMSGNIPKNVNKICCCGNALSNNEVLRRAIVEMFEQIQITNINFVSGESVKGAALSLCPRYIFNF